MRTPTFVRFAVGAFILGVGSSLVAQEPTVADKGLDPTTIKFDAIDEQATPAAKLPTPVHTPNLTPVPSQLPSSSKKTSLSSGTELQPMAPTARQHSIIAQPVAASKKIEQKSSKANELTPLTFRVNYPSAIVLQEPLEVQIEVTNPNSVDVKEARLVLSLPAHLQFNSATPEPVNVGDEQIEFSLVDLPAGNTSKVIVNVVPTDKQAISFETQLMIVNRERVEIAVQEPVLEISVTGPERLIAGDVAEFLVTVVNNGDGPARTLQLKPAITSGWKLVENNESDLSVEALSPGEQHVFKILASFAGEGPAKIEFVATARAAATKTASTSITAVKPELEIQAFGPKSAFVNHRNVYGLKVRNSGQADLSNVQLQLGVPTGAVVHTVSRQCTGETQPNQLNWILDSLHAGEEAEIQWIASCEKTGNCNFDMTLTSKETKAKTISLPTVIESRADLSMSLRNTNDPIPAGEATEYVVLVENNGTSPAKNVTVQIELPSTWVAVSKGETELTQAQRTLDFVIDNLPAKEKRELRFKAGSNTPGEYVVRAKLSTGTSRISLTAEDSTLVYKSDSHRVSDKAGSVIR
jgi:uncharacterized repeat protein (TIGR01451 family)